MAALALALPASAQGAEIRTAGFPAEPSFSGERVVWADRGPGLRSFAVKAAVPGEAATALAAAPVLGGGSTSALVPALAASASHVLFSTYAYDHYSFGTDPRYVEHHVATRGHPFERVARCPGELRPYRSIDVSGDAYVFRQCDEGAGHVEIREAGAGPASSPRSVGTGGFGVRIAGRHVAWLDGRLSREEDPNVADLVVFDRVADTEVYRIPAAELPGQVHSLDVQDDGKVAIAYDPVAASSDQRVRVAWASPAEPRPHLLPLKGADAYDVRIQGDSIAFQRGRDNSGSIPDAEVGVADLAGSAQVVARGTDDEGFRGGFDYDGARLVWRRLGCDRWRLVVHDARTAAPPPPRERCRLRFKAPPRLRGERVILPIRCAPFLAGCYTTSVVLRTAEGGRDRVVGRAGVGEGTARVGLDRAARRALAARGSLRLTATAVVRDNRGRTQERSVTFRLRR